MKLNLGVIDIPYIETEESETTGEVAEKLERQYGVMMLFYLNNSQSIADKLGESFTNAIDNAILGAPEIPANQMFNDACQEIQTKFKQFLDMKEMDYMVRGVPTKASLMGVSHRFKKVGGKRAGYTKGKKGIRPPRPSFIDTGLYRQSFKAWVE